MSTIFYIFVIFFFSLSAILVDRRIQKLKLAQQAEGAATKESVNPAVAAAVTKRELALRFRTWSNSAFAHEPAIQRWIQALSEPGLEGLVEALVHFCREMEVDLKWLVTQDLSHHPATQRQLTAMIGHYCQACHNAIAAQREAAVLQMWYAVEQNPAQQEYQPLIQSLFTQLSEQNLIAPFSPEEVAVSKRDRQTLTMRKILEVAQNEPARFYKILPVAVATAQTSSQTTALEQAFQKAFASIRSAKKSTPSEVPMTNGA